MKKSKSIENSKPTGGDWEAFVWGKDLEGNEAEAVHEIGTVVNAVNVILCDVPISNEFAMMQDNGKGGSKKGASYKISKAESIANLHLLAAAKDLLKALEKMYSLHAGQQHLYGLTESGEELFLKTDHEAFAAIKKAKMGEDPKGGAR